MENLDKKRVIIGMSGGVDSSVAAYLLKKQGYDVIGIMMNVWPEKGEDFQEKEGGCCGLSAVDDARRVANKLDIPFYVVNFKEVFEKKVIDYFVDEYMNGRTPNPCIACNKYLKFEELLKKAHQLGAYYVATGHYAKIYHDEKINKSIIKKSNSVKKDQTYALYNLTQDQVKHILMPLGEFSSKQEVRKIAIDLGLDTAAKPDSQEICFVEDDNYGRFIEEERGEKIKKGKFVDIEGNVVGEHKGIVHYTVGQRKGLGIALGKPTYVVKIDSVKNEVVLGDNKDVFNKGLIAENVNFIHLHEFVDGLEVECQIRYNSNPSKAKLYHHSNDFVKVLFEEDQRAITPGQAVVFYDGDLLLGGGTITKAI
ncbi:MAG: tRNA 2-thiouridine(34) synthase MnmA [Anaeromicrobium sp.]|jgi:tRNA-specific 2-thiouridylase|uniref:tRNA 2-thiouridine(34) synthase MnmA n=1 Tax=Anaeromicrobium sp. TaxID=1929132 RepID=UPI0025D868B5|nr:tRNA 2-thiouridine(34) synthase MnmA [Anaeromicrobium sp.]MCT4595040.1 tRNA 2-thiouridine(34) synthase MnmA [Anaeromicrobium sp.]